MAIGSDRVGYGKIHIQIQNFYPYLNPIRTQKIPENEYVDPIQWIWDQIWVYSRKPDSFWIGYPKLETRTQNLNIFIIINIVSILNRTCNIEHRREMNFNVPTSIIILFIETHSSNPQSITFSYPRG